MVTRIVVLGLLVSALAACKIELRAPVDATVSSINGAHICRDEAICGIDVVDLSFEETFIARTADSELVFDHWKAGNQHLCGDTKLPCHLSTADFEGSDLLMSFLDSAEVFVLEPVFTDPYERRLPRIKLEGEWDYVQRWGGCSATGRIENEFRYSATGTAYIAWGGGKVPTYTMSRRYTPGSTIVTSVEPCRTVVAADATAPGALISDMPSNSLNEFQWEKYLNFINTAEIVFQVLDYGKYRISRDREGVMDTFTYTQIPYPGITDPCQLDRTC